MRIIFEFTTFKSKVESEISTVALSANLYILIMLCFIFDINYPKTFEIIDKDEVVETIFKRFNFKDEETKEKMKEIRKELKEYINKNKG